jgi:hypothetical protein
MNFLQPWDLIDILFVEYPDSGYMWVVDPTVHATDDWFGIRDNVPFRDHEPGTQVEIIRRIMTIEFYKEGEYNLTFVRAHTNIIPEMARVDNLKISFSKTSGVIDDRYVLPVKVSS